MKVRSHKVSRSMYGDVTLVLVLSGFALFMAIPLLFAIGNAFKPLDEIWVFPPHFFPHRPTLQNFRDLSIVMGNSWVTFSRYLFNTIFVTVAGTVGLIIFASMCAYPLAKKAFPGGKAIFSLIVTSLMFHSSVTSIPTYLIMSKMHLIDTYAALILPAMCMPLGLYLMKQFMEQIPDAIIESASMDGASEYRIFGSIIMPNVKPAWLTLIIFSVQALWGIGASPYIYKEELKSLAYALSQILASGLARAGVGGAVTLIMMLVPISVFLITQSNIIETMATSGMKD